jgi:hypothetical protein
MVSMKYLAGFGAMALVSMPALAQDAAAEPAAPVLSAGPGGALTTNPKPFNFDVPVLGTLYVTGAATGLLGTQSHTTPGTSSSFADVSNAEIVVQKVDGVFQFLVQAGLYSQGTLGVPYTRASTYTDNVFGPVPQAWIKIAPTANFSVQGGILPTIIGAEGAYTFQNQNIDRGMLWGQENVMTRGVQANLALGKLSLSLQFTDGFFSGKMNWLSGIATYAVDSKNSIAFVAGGPLNTTYRSSGATPPVFNNSTIYNIIYTYTNGPVFIQPYLQYTRVAALPLLGSGRAETYSGAMLARYTFNEHWSLPVRFEYIDSKAKDLNAPSLLYGAGSNAFSFTVTPTYVWKQFFARAEFSVVSASDITPGFAFGASGNDKSQVRGKFEFGVTF